MSIAKITTNYAPDVYKSLNGILLLYKPPNLGSKDLEEEIRLRISDGLNQLQPRPLSTKLVAVDRETSGDPQYLEKPNLADHPLVIGPRYVPWELSVLPFKPMLSFKSSGVSAFAIGDYCGRYSQKIRFTRLINVYHLTGKFGYMTDNHFNDGKIMDKSTYNHIRSSKLDSVLSRIETSQADRLFDSANVPLASQEAYELAKSWPSRPPKMAVWPVIYRLRCIHLKLPEFKLEVTISNESQQFLSELVHEVGILNKTTAYTESIRRVKLGLFSVDGCLTDRDWNLQAFVDNMAQQHKRLRDIDEMFRQHRGAMSVKTEYKPSYEKESESSHKHNQRNNKRL